MYLRYCVFEYERTIIKVNWLLSDNRLSVGLNGFISLTQNTHLSIRFGLQSHILYHLFIIIDFNHNNKWNQLYVNLYKGKRSNGPSIAVSFSRNTRSNISLCSVLGAFKAIRHHWTKPPARTPINSIKCEYEFIRTHVCSFSGILNNNNYTQSYK